MRLRAPVLEDAPEVLDLLAARDIADLGMVDFELGDLLDEWRSAEIDLAADAVLAVRDGGAIVGYAIMRARGALGAVDPRHEGDGIGALLREWTERRGRALGRELHGQLVAAGNERAQSLMGAAGYSVLAHLEDLVARGVVATDGDPVIGGTYRMAAA